MTPTPPVSTAPLSAVLFDFNGTLFLDEKYHERAWAMMGERIGRPIAGGELERCLIGLSNEQILTYLFEERLDKDRMNALSEEKEALYRTLCLRDRPNCLLAPGAEAFLDFLKGRDVPVNIATSSIKANVDFFFETFALHRWFERDRTVYDDGLIACKPAPDMYRKAAENIRAPIRQAMVIEDSKGGIRSAVSAGAGCVVAIVPRGKRVDFAEMKPYIHQFVSDFTQIDCDRFG